MNIKKALLTVGAFAVATLSLLATPKAFADYNRYYSDYNPYYANNNCRCNYNNYMYMYNRYYPNMNSHNCNGNMGYNGYFDGNRYGGNVYDYSVHYMGM